MSSACLCLILLIRHVKDGRLAVDIARAIRIAEAPDELLIIVQKGLKDLKDQGLAVSNSVDLAKEIVGYIASLNPDLDTSVSQRKRSDSKTYLPLTSSWVASLWSSASRSE